MFCRPMLHVMYIYHFIFSEQHFKVPVVHSAGITRLRVEQIYMVAVAKSKEKGRK